MAACGVALVFVGYVRRLRGRRRLFDTACCAPVGWTAGPIAVVHLSWLQIIPSAITTPGRRRRRHRSPVPAYALRCRLCAYPTIRPSTTSRPGRCICSFSLASEYARTRHRVRQRPRLVSPSTQTSTASGPSAVVCRSRAFPSPYFPPSSRTRRPRVVSHRSSHIMRAPSRLALCALFCLATALAVDAEVYFEENFPDGECGHDDDLRRRRSRPFAPRRSLVTWRGRSSRSRVTRPPPDHCV